MILYDPVIICYLSMKFPISQLRLPQRALHASKSCVRTPAAPDKLFASLRNDWDDSNNYGEDDDNPLTNHCVSWGLVVY